jgi:hypothetical protein
MAKVPVQEGTKLVTSTCPAYPCRLAAEMCALLLDVVSHDLRCADSYAHLCAWMQNVLDEALSFDAGESSYALAVQDAAVEGAITAESMFASVRLTPASTASLVLRISGSTSHTSA